jgi:hypothetical protein
MTAELSGSSMTMRQSTLPVAEVEQAHAICDIGEVSAVIRQSPTRTDPRTERE